MVDNHSGEVPLGAAWRPLARRAAVAGGSFAALVSLIRHAPVSIASLRGAAAFFAVLLVARVGLAALELSLAADRRAEEKGRAPRR